MLVDGIFSQTIIIFSIYVVFFILRTFFIRKHINRIQLFYINNVKVSQYVSQTTNILHVLCYLKSMLLIDELHSPLMQLTYMYVFFKYYNSRKYVNLMQPALQTLQNLSFVLVNGRGQSYFFEKKREKLSHLYYGENSTY